MLDDDEDEDHYVDKVEEQMAIALAEDTLNIREPPPGSDYGL